MKRGSCGALKTLALLLPLITLAPGHAAAVTVSVVPPDTTVLLGDTFNLRIVTDAFPNLKGFDVIYRFDPNVLQVLSGSPGDVLTSSGNPYVALLVNDYVAPRDSAWYDAAMLVGATAGPGVLNFFTFKALNVGVSNIECRLVDFRDPNNVQTLPNCAGGRVEVVAPVPTHHGSWGRLKTLYRR